MKKSKMNKGITLIALILTIIVLLILAVVAINAVTGDGIIAHAKNARTDYTRAQENEIEMLDKYKEQLEAANGTTKPTVVFDGKTVTLTKDNVKDYLGKVVTNYAPTTGSVTISGTTYNVSKQYRLFYVDFDNKYGDGAGTIYLKADCTSDDYTFDSTDTTAATESNIKIRNLNPELYKSGITAPSANNENMKKVTWLLNTNNWESLKTGVDSSIANKINYVVGAPSLEIMMDSYNTRYELNSASAEPETIYDFNVKYRLFYKYSNNSNGYIVGPTDPTDTSATDNWSTFTAQIVWDVDGMYAPPSNNLQRYWLASPSNFLGGYIFNVCYMKDTSGKGRNRHISCKLKT